MLGTTKLDPNMDIAVGISLFLISMPAYVTVDSRIRAKCDPQRRCKSPSLQIEVPATIVITGRIFPEAQCHANSTSMYLKSALHPPDRSLAYRLEQGLDFGFEGR